MVNTVFVLVKIGVVLPKGCIKPRMKSLANFLNEFLQNNSICKPKIQTFLFLVSKISAKEPSFFKNKDEILAWF